MVLTTLLNLPVGINSLNHIHSVNFLVTSYKLNDFRSNLLVDLGSIRHVDKNDEQLHYCTKTLSDGIILN